MGLCARKSADSLELLRLWRPSAPRPMDFLQATALRAADAGLAGASTSAAAAGGWSELALALAMASHPRLGASVVSSVCKVASSPDLLLAIFKEIPLVVPDDAPTLCSALRKAAPWQRIMLGSGEFLVSFAGADHPGSSVLRISAPVHISGEGEARTVCAVLSSLRAPAPALLSPICASTTAAIAASAVTAGGTAHTAAAALLARLGACRMAPRA